MARITLDIPDELWEKLEAMSELLALSLEQPPLPARIYQYILDFILSKPTPEEIIAFRPTSEMEERLRMLLERSKGGKITAAESKELDEYERIQHIMIMLKTGVFLR
ncbi:MAG: hypothetical protein SXA11_15545 [Cyanobacteriota bacterium]|nr:hypothetical protein [Cyanobacteriota bacterium]